MGNLKNNITVIVVVAVFSFARILSNVLFYNFTVEKAALLQMIGMENADAAMTFFDTDIDDSVEIIKNDDRVRKIIIYEDMYVSTSETEFKLTIADDFSVFETNLIVKGRYAESANEINISSVMSRLTNKKVGDMINIKIGSASGDYLITGLIKGINESGYLGCMTTDGFKKLNAEHKARTLYIFLNDGTNVEEFVTGYSTEFIGQAIVLDFGKAIGATIDSLSSTISLVVMLIIIVTILVIAFVLYLLISALIRKMKKNIGIMKALGYSNFQLMRQIIYTFMPSALIGSFIGGISGLFGSNSVCTLMLSSMGITKAAFIVPALSSVLIGVAMIFLNLIITMLVSFRIKKITAYKLIVE